MNAHDFARMMVPKILEFIQKKGSQPKLRTLYECLVWNAFAAARGNRSCAQELAVRLIGMEKVFADVESDQSNWNDKYEITKDWGRESGFADCGELKLTPDIAVGVDGEIVEAIQAVEDYYDIDVSSVSSIISSGSSD
jgi:hypothetical protein